MKVLWTSNIIFPDVCDALGVPNTISGGWLYSMFLAMRTHRPDWSIAVVAMYKSTEFKQLVINGVVYYLVPYLKGKDLLYTKQLESYCVKVLNDFQPDLIHVNGTEYGRGISFQNTAPNIPQVVTIQGLVSVIERYYYGGMSHWDILRNGNWVAVLRRTLLWEQRKDMKKRGRLERKLIANAQHIVGRTAWDKVHALAVNPKVQYYLCNEILRKSFYKHKWEYNTCEKHSIMVSSSASPLKGFHQLLKALPLILQHYPDTKVYVANGHNIKERKGVIEYLRKGSYEIYLKKLIKKLNLQDKIIYFNSLNEEEMCQRYLLSNVFVCPSSIENSSNSLGEAQLLGVPCVASYVGGNPDFMKGNEENLYRFEEVGMLASKVCTIFRKGAEVSTDTLRKLAQKRHCPETNVMRLLEIYESVLNS